MNRNIKFYLFISTLTISPLITPINALAEEQDEKAKPSVEASLKGGASATDQGVAGTVASDIKLNALRTKVSLTGHLNENFFRARANILAPELPLKTMVRAKAEGGSVWERSVAVHVVSLSYDTVQAEGQATVRLGQPQPLDSAHALASTGPAVNYVVVGGSSGVLWTVEAKAGARVGGGIAKLGEVDALKVVAGPQFHAKARHEMIFPTSGNGMGYELAGDGSMQFNFLRESDVARITTTRAKLLYVLKPSGDVTIKVGPHFEHTNYHFRQQAGTEAKADINAYEFGGHAVLGI